MRDHSDGEGRALFDVWMSHGDRVDALPPGFVAVGFTNNVPLAAMADESRHYYGVQFHPEVTHTLQGLKILERFVREICGCEARWQPGHIITDSIARVREQVGRDKVLLGLSGGVDSSVVGALLHRALGEQLVCVFVDHGLLRLDEGEQVMETFAKHMGVRVIRVNAEARFLDALKGESDPERKRKIIGRLFVEVFEEEAAKLPGIRWLAQGTIYPDVIESAGAKTGKAHVIKSHHNVGGLPEKMNLKLLEPLRELFKDEVRKLGVELGLPREMVYRHPFPGPGLGVRILGEVTQAVRRSAAQSRCDLHRRAAQARSLRPDEPGVRGIPAGALGRGDGRWAPLRLRDRVACRRDDRLHDRALVALAVRVPGAGLPAHHQRSERHLACHLRHLEQAARHHRVGVREITWTAARSCTKPPAWADLRLPAACPGAGLLRELDPGRRWQP